jgi:spore coat protein CotH
MTASGRSFSAELPAQDANSIVRYRILDGSEVLSPRPSDPYGWHAYFVDPEIDSSSRIYHLFINTGDWTDLWDNIQNNRVVGCDPSPTWDARVPGVFVSDGRVYDVRLRYQGSSWNRTWGREINRWQVPGPDRPDPLLALSWRVTFPRYARFGDAHAIILNKLTQGCPGITSEVGYELFRRVGLAAPTTRYVRVQVNGGYYHYMQEIGAIDEVLMERTFEGDPVGHLFKAAGYYGDDGPYNFADGRLFDASCGYTPEERYAYSYERKTHEWAGHENLIALIEGMHAARGDGDAALRTYLEANFDIPLTLSYLAVINWLGPWDDFFHNYFLYQRRSDGLWLLFPWDLDWTAGGNEFADAQSSIFIGEEGDQDARDGLWNYFKDSFFRAYRTEFVARLQELNDTVLAPAVVQDLVDQTVAALDEQEALAAPAGMECDLAEQANTYREFADARHDVVASR